VMVYFLQCHRNSFYHQDRPAQSVEMVRAAMASTAALNPRYGPAPTLTDARLRQNARDDI